MAKGLELTKEASGLLEKSVRERVQYIKKDHFTSYTVAEQHLAFLCEILDSPTVGRPECALLYGPTSNGKSTILSEFQSRAGEQQLVPSPGTSKVISIVCPAVPELSRIYARILLAAGAPAIRSRSGGDLEIRAFEVLAALGTRVLAIDEIQNLIAGSLKQHDQAMNLLVNLTSECKISIAAAGTDTAFNAIERNKVLVSRFDSLHLPVWTWGEELSAVLSTFESRIPLPEFSGLGTAKLGKIILKRSGGVIGEMVRMIRKASCLAFLEGLPRIDEDVLTRCNYRGPQERREAFVRT